MSRTSFTRRFSFNSGRKNSREGKHPPSASSHHHHHHHQDGSQHSQHHPNPHHHHHNSLQDKRQHSRRENPDAEKVARGIFGDVPLTDTERRFLSSAETGHLVALEQCVEENGSLNLTCRDYLGRTALQLAVLGEHFDCIQYLLEKSSLDVIEEALLHAIKTENVKICDMFLSHPMYSDKRARMQLEFQHGFYDQEDNSSSFAPDITPVVLAAQCNNFDIVHMLIQKGFTIQRPHHYFCYCTECSNHKTFDRFVHSRSRLNAYRGLASTAYLSLSCDDPILTAFELSKSLQNLAETEKEYKNEYRSLSESCKSYAVDLLDLCRSNEEVMAALHGGSDTRDLSRIKMAIRYEQKKFIAHASCQEHLMSMWYSGVPWFQHQPFTMKLFLLPLGIMFIPVTAIVYVFLPYSRVGEVLRSPFMKFVNYICSYTAFLVLLFFATTLTSTSHNIDLFTGTEGVVNSLIMFYVLGMFWAECKQLWEMGVRGYFSQMWNYMDITMLALYTAAYAIEGVIYTKVIFLQRGIIPKPSVSMGSEDDGIPDPQILARILFSVANVMSFARIAYILPASETFGQLQISYGRMLQDVGKFIFIYFTVMIAFICGLTSLYSLSDNAYFTNLVQTTGTLFWAAFGMGYAAAPEIERGENEEKGRRDNMVELVGYILYGVYILGAVVVLINMLIAMMSNTFEEIQECEDSEWKFARAKLWISFIEEGTTLPIPFNIVPTPKSIIKMVYYIKNVFLDCTRDFVETDDRDGGFSIDYKAIMHKVVLRYVHKMKFEKKGDSLKEDLLDAKEEILSQTYNLCSAIHSRIDSLERHMYSIGRDPSYMDKVSLAHSVGAISPVTATTTATTASTTSTSGTAASAATLTATPTNPTEVRIITSTPSPSPHRSLHTTLSMPCHVTDSQHAQQARLTAGFYEPRREFVSRRWSYYSHDRPRRSERQVPDNPEGAARNVDSHQQQQQRQQQRRQQQDEGRGDNNTAAAQRQHESGRRLQRQNSRTDYSPVRYEGRGDHSPVRYQDRGDHSPVRFQDRGHQLSVKGRPSDGGSRDGRRSAGRPPDGNKERLQRSFTQPAGGSASQRSTNRPYPSPSQRGDLSPQSPSQQRSPAQSPSQETPILRPDLTPTHSHVLRREFSRTERHVTRGGGTWGGSSPSGRGSRSPNMGGGGMLRSISPRASPNTSPIHPVPEELHSSEMEMASERHARTQSLHRGMARSASRPPGVPTQRSKEV